MLRAFHPDLDALHNRAPISSKTPGRGLLQTKSLLNAENRAGPLSVGLKGKRVALAPQTPATSNGKSVPKTAIRIGALHDKTPFVNRQIQTPALGTKKQLVLATPLQQVQERTPPSAKSLPSATRTRLRVPHNLFETPAVNGNPWDVSEGSIELQGPIAISPSATSIVLEDFDDIEYMPPTAIMPEYDPPFELPNYAKLGADLRTVAHLARFPDEDVHDPHNDFNIHAFMPPTPPRSLLLSANDSDSDLELFPNLRRAQTDPLRVRGTTTKVTSTQSRTSRTILGVPASRMRPADTTSGRKPLTDNRPPAATIRPRSRVLSRPTAPTPGLRPTAPTPGRQAPIAAPLKAARTAAVAPPVRRATVRSPVTAAPQPPVQRAVGRLTHARTASSPSVFQRTQAPAPTVATRPTRARSASTASAMSRASKVVAVKRPPLDIVLQVTSIAEDEDMADFVLNTGGL